MSQPYPPLRGVRKNIFAEISKNFLIFAKNRFFGTKKGRKASFKNSSENPTEIGLEMKKIWILEKKFFLVILFLKFLNFFLKKFKNDDVIKLIGNRSLDANEEEKVCEVVFSNDIGPILRGGQYAPPPLCSTIVKKACV